MRTSQLWLPTKRHVTQETKARSHEWMLRAGMIQPLGSGIYSWLPMGFRVLKKLIQHIRSHMEGLAEEVLLPSLQPASLWEQSQRIDAYGPELFQLKDRKGRAFILAPTHEENISQFFAEKKLPISNLPKVFFQIQTKFRDEKRPRSGLIRAREFIMKDAYSFHADSACLEGTYSRISKAYHQLLQSLELEYAVVRAAPGAMGGQLSEEFHAFCEAGEDRLLEDSSSPHVQLADSVPCCNSKLGAPFQKLQWLPIPMADSTACFLLLVEDDTPNLHKLKTSMPSLCLESIATEPSSCDELPTGNTEIQKIFIDHQAAHNLQEAELSKIQGQATEVIFGDFRYPREGETLPSGGKARLRKSLEIAHIFQLGNRYTRAFKVRSELSSPLLMGCYGIGISRLCAAIIEQKCKGSTMVWPDVIAPFHIALIPIQGDKHCKKIEEQTQKLYHQLRAQGWEVLWDDRTSNLGTKLKDLELWGIKHWVWVGKSYRETGKLEYCCVNQQSCKVLLEPQSLIEKLALQRLATKAA